MGDLSKSKIYRSAGREAVMEQGVSLDRGINHHKWIVPNESAATRIEVAVDFGTEEARIVVTSLLKAYVTMHYGLIGQNWTGPALAQINTLKMGVREIDAVGNGTGE